MERREEGPPAAQQITENTRGPNECGNGRGR